MPVGDTGEATEEAPATEVRDGSEFARVPDGLERTWVPHRAVYLGANGKNDACPFCEVPKKSDEDGLIVARGSTAFVVLNLYPYNSGHLLVCPYRHISTYDEATPAEVAEIGALTQEAMRVLRASSNAQGFNIGMNQGSLAGAGVAAHLHQHIIPRWHGDTNFFPLIGKTKAIPELLADVRARLASAWPTDSGPTGTIEG